MTTTAALADRISIVEKAALATLELAQVQAGRDVVLIANLTVLASAVTALGFSVGQVSPPALARARATLRRAVDDMAPEMREAASLALAAVQAWDAAAPAQRRSGDSAVVPIEQARPRPTRA